MFVDFDSQKDVSIPKTERLEMAPKRRNPGQIFLRVMAEKWWERPFVYTTPKARLFAADPVDHIFHPIA
jgi:hypothetical protein